jgi:hypothetical protein
MPFTYARDDERRLVRVTATDPFTLDDMFAMADRHANEGAWEYALIFDARPMTADAWFDPGLVKAHLLKAGAGRPPGPVALVVGLNPDRFREALRHPGGVAGLGEFEVLVTDRQVEDWIHRHGTRPYEPPTSP